MTVDAVDLYGVPGFSVELAVAVTVLLEVAVDAVHTFFEMNVFEVYGFPEFVRDRRTTLACPGVEQVSLAVVLEDGAENPSVAVEVAELRVL